MNKFVIVAVTLSSFAPTIMFASSDWSWGLSQQGTSHQGGGMGTGIMTGSGQQGSGMTTPPPPRTPIGSGAVTGSGMMDHDMHHSPKLPMGTGAMMDSGDIMERDMKSIGIAIGQLSPTDREALIKIIKDYLLSKGINPAKYTEIRQEIKEVKKDTRTEVKDIRKTAMEAAKAKREEMRAKIKNIRSTGKVNVQDISLTK